MRKKKTIIESDTTKILVPVKNDDELEEVLQAHENVEKLECDKNGYTALEGTTSDLEDVIEELGFEEPLKEFEEKFEESEVEMKKDDEIKEEDEEKLSEEDKLEEENDELRQECEKLAKECQELRKECGDLDEEDDDEYCVPESDDPEKENKLLKKECKKLECELKELQDKLEEDDDKDIKESFKRWAFESEDDVDEEEDDEKLSEEDDVDEEDDEKLSEEDEEKVSEEDDEKLSEEDEEDDEKLSEEDEEDDEKLSEEDDVDEEDEEKVSEEDKDDIKESYSITKSLKAIVANHAALRLESIKETIDSQLMETTLFESMDSGEATKVKKVVAEAVDAVIEKSCLAVAKDVTKLYESYVNTEVIPYINKRIQKKVIPSVVKNLNENVDKYLKYAAKEISEDLMKNGMLVYSPKSEMLEEFTTDILSLIRRKLQIMPKREEALLKAKSHIAELNEEIQDKSVEYKRMRKAYIQMKRDNYVLTHLPSNISESQKEILVNYAKDELSECVTMNEFRKAFKKACDELDVVNEETKSVSKKKITSKSNETISDVLFRIG